MAKQQTTPNTNKGEMVYCERCGEDYSATYRRCPFCDERPGRRIDDYGAARSPLRLVVLIGSLVLTTAVIEIPFIANAFGFTPIGWDEYGIAMGLAILVIPVVEIVKLIQRAVRRSQ